MIKKLHFKHLSIGAILILLNIAGCKKDVSQSTTPPTTSNGLKTHSAGDNLYDLLGFGYDISGAYASANSSTFKVIEIEKLVADEPNRLATDINVNQDTYYYSGGNAEDYIKNKASKYTLNAGITGIFSMDFSQNYHESSTISSKYSYASASIVIKQKRLRFDTPIDVIKANYLTALFKSDVNSMTPQQLVTKYGTHVLVDIVLGAKLDMYYRSQNNSSNRGEGAKAGISVNVLAKMFGGSTDNSYQDSTVKSNYNQTLYYRTVGGDGTKGLIAGPISLDNTAPKVDISSWQSSCTRENAAFVDFGGSEKPVILLSDLISDPAKKTAVKNYIDQYLASKQIKLTPDPIYLFNHKSLDHYISADINATAGFTDWAFYGSEFKAFIGPVAGTVPVYLFIHTSLDHFSSTDRHATDGFANWGYAGVQFYVYKTQQPGTVPIYTYITTKGKMDHYVTPDPNIAAKYPNWGKAGVAFYAYPNTN